MTEVLPWATCCALARLVQREAPAAGRAYYRYRLLTLWAWYARYPANDDDHDPAGYYQEIIVYKLAECLAATFKESLYGHA